MSVVLGGQYEEFFSKEALNNIINKIYVYNHVNNFNGETIKVFHKKLGSIDYIINESTIMIGKKMGPWIRGDIQKRCHFFKGNVQILLRIYPFGRLYNREGGIYVAMHGGKNPYEKGYVEYDICFRPVPIPIHDIEWQKDWEDIDFLIELKHLLKDSIKMLFNKKNFV